MNLTQSQLPALWEHLETVHEVALDTETTGLRPYHGDRLFSVAVATIDQSFYLNFQRGPDIPEEYVLPIEVLKELRDRLTFHRVVMHNAKFDMAMLRFSGIELNSPIYDTMVMARLYENDHFDYGLDAVGERYLGIGKDDTLLKYLEKEKLWHWVETPGGRKKNKHFYEAPFDMISQYAKRDVELTIKLYGFLIKGLQGMNPPHDEAPHIMQVLCNEVELTKTVFQMEWEGVKVDLDYCKAASQHFSMEMRSAATDFHTITGMALLMSPKLFKQVFNLELVSRTKLGNPSFDEKSLAKLDHPAAKAVLRYRDAKKSSEYFENFTYFADKNGVIHSDLKQAGTGSGRFSSANPNLQNLTKDDEADPGPYPIRRAFIPRDDYCFVMIDYEQMEYLLMMDIAEARGLISEVKGGLDVHAATAKLARISRQQAKTTNFSVLYGAGIKTLSQRLGTSEVEARRIRDTIFDAAPEIKTFIRRCMNTAESRGYIYNWLGRVARFTDPRFAYKAPNYLIQGGSADVMKVAMNRESVRLREVKSKMILQIHDELIFEVHKDELDIVPQLKAIMESTYPGKLLKLTAGVEHSWRSLFDKAEGLPVQAL